jgi:hypothetical protein
MIGPITVEKPCEGFIDLREFSVCDKNDVLVVNRELAGQRIGFCIAEIKAVNDRRYAVRRPACDRLA